MAEGTKSRGIVIAGLALAAILGGGTYYVTGPLKCQRLEDDFLNNVDSMQTWISAKSLLEASGKPAGETGLLETRSRRRMEGSYIALTQECGSRRAGNAMREARDLVTR